MKANYEAAAKFILPMRLPVLMRLDGKAFHTWTKNLDKPFDDGFIKAMSETALYLCEEIHTAQFAYIQSDEISVLLHNYKRLKTRPFFDNEVQKMASVSAGMASAFFTLASGRIAVFDSRVSAYPESEVVNYFIWRQKDAERNSVQMLARSLFGQRELSGKKQSDLHEMMHGRGINWSHLPAHKKRGFGVVRMENGWMMDWEIPVFSQNRNYVGKLLACEEA